MRMPSKAIFHCPICTKLMAVDLLTDNVSLGVLLYIYVLS